MSADRPKRRRGLRRTLGVPVGAVGALVLFFLCASLATPLVGTADAVSAQKICKWRHTTNWADSLDEPASYTIGAVSCNRTIGVRVACQVLITMGVRWAAGDNTRTGYCNTKASLRGARRSSVLNYAAGFSFALQLTNRNRRWTQGFTGGSVPNDLCQISRVQGLSTLMCHNTHPS